MKLSEAIQKVIVLDDAIHAYWQRELPKRFRNWPFIEPGEDPDDLGPRPPEEAKLKRLLTKLPEDMLYQLLFVKYLGQGRYTTTADLGSQFEAMKEEASEGRDWAITMMMHTPSAFRLTEGLEHLKRMKIDVDSMLPKVAV